MSRIELIKAGAGSGKTHHLADLLSERLIAGTRPESLLVTTFTVKAAAELQSRIRRKLAEGPKPELAARVFDGLIGTVNSVCGRLLKEYAVDAGLSPALDVLPDEDIDAVLGRAAGDVMCRYEEKLEDAAARLSLNPIEETAFRKNRDWRNDVREVLKLARSNGLDATALKSCGERSAAALKTVFPATISLSLSDIGERIRGLRDFPAQGDSTGKTVRDIRSFLLSPTWEKAARLANAGYAKTKDPEFPIDVFHEIGERLTDSRELYEDMSAVIRGVFDCAGESLEAYARYKKDFGLVDFVDQECNVLSLLESNPDFASRMKQRLSLCVVDEFHDTSPVQLALFLKLNECSEDGSVWVGDPKQSIYGFRGTDPELMGAVAATIPDCRTLPFSWRSKETLVRLFNEIFTRVFSPVMREDDVILKIPPERREEAAGGIIEAWRLDGGKKMERMRALASGIAELIRDRGAAPNQICVLFRSNGDCSSLAEALKERNIPASAPAGSLLSTFECQLVMSAFRYCIDPSDTVALVTLAALYGETPGWLGRLHRAKEAWLALGEEEQRKTDFLAEFRGLEFLGRLRKEADATPMEILEHVITALNLDGKISSMPSADRRLNNMDALRRLCGEYMQRALVERRAATPAGFVAALNGADAKQAAGFGSDSVSVMTYHRAKGLEWPIVILGSLDTEERDDAFGIAVNQAETFDVKSPLRGRTVHYWPWPFGDVRKLKKLDETLSSNPIDVRARKRERDEGKRLLYVGLTRAREHVIFALNGKSAARKTPEAADTPRTGWLDSLSDAPLLKFPAGEGDGTLAVGEALFPMVTRTFSPPAGDVEPFSSPAVFADQPRSVSPAEAVPARLAPSDESCGDGAATLLCRWSYRGAVRCESAKYRLLGRAFHDFIAMNPQRDRREIACRLLRNWTVDEDVQPEVLMECADNLYRWIAGTYPEAEISCEVPMTWHDENGTLYQGFIDMLLKLPDAFVIIDHKTHPAASDAAGHAAGCAGQLRVYRRAVEAATGKTVRQTIIHFPNLGMCFEVK